MHSEETPSGSVTGLIASLQLGDRGAFASLWERYAEQLAKSAQERLPSRARSCLDGEDVAQSVFTAIWKAADSGRLQDLGSRSELWWLLLAITKRKVVDRIRSELSIKRGGGAVFNESALNNANDTEPWFSFEQIVRDEPTPIFIMQMEEQYRHLMSMLTDEIARRIATARIEGYAVDEIARSLGIGKRTVERKLSMIRGRWAKCLDLACHD